MSRTRFFRTVAATAAMTTTLLALPTTYQTVPAGHVGVMHRFGRVHGETLQPGFNLKNPLDSVELFDIRSRSQDFYCTAPSKEGLAVDIKLSVIYNVDKTGASELYKSVGRDFMEVIFKPQVLSIIRDVTTAFGAKELYTSGSRVLVSNTVKDHLTETSKKRGINIEEIRIRDVSMPYRLKEAIEDKLKAEQASLQMAFVLEKEKAEAQRKEIEAGGINRFQKIVAEGVSANLLKWKGIEATERLASSKNAKVIVIGGSEGLPLILNGK